MMIRPKRPLLVPSRVPTPPGCSAFTLTPEQLNEDKISFAHSLLSEAYHDLRKLGLVLDTLKIKNVPGLTRPRWLNAREPVSAKWMIAPASSNTPEPT